MWFMLITGLITFKVMFLPGRHEIIISMEQTSLSDHQVLFSYKQQRAASFSLKIASIYNLSIYCAAVYIPYTLYYIDTFTNYLLSI